MAVSASYMSLSVSSRLCSFLSSTRCSRGSDRLQSVHTAGMAGQAVIKCCPSLCTPAGSPTLGGHMPTQVSVALGTVIQEQRAKQLPCGVFGSFG
jgi:hypothetical protein